MRRLHVYADFDWLKETEPVGELFYETSHGSDSYSFSFDEKWLERHGNVYLSADLTNYTGRQYTQHGSNIFGCFSDTLPDRWGRILLLRREQIAAKEEKRFVRRLSSFDLLSGIDDFSRMGAFRFKEDKNGSFINDCTSFIIPPITNIRELLDASQHIEKSEKDNILPQKKWINQLLQPGSSLGGARPKANVTGADKTLYIAKFPSCRDVYDVGLWEHFSHVLALKAGINAAATSVVLAGGKYHVLLSRRFDRTGDGRRIHFASAMSLLGLEDGDGRNTGHGYLDIVDFIVQNCTDVAYNLQELFRRVAFNICIGNSDDHFRNHGFLLTPKGWTLSPAYDMNPTTVEEQSLLVDRGFSTANLDILFKAYKDYFIDRQTAEKIVGEVVNAVKDWRKVAASIGISGRDTDIFREVLDGRCRCRT